MCMYSEEPLIKDAPKCIKGHNMKKNRLDISSLSSEERLLRAWSQCLDFLEVVFVQRHQFQVHQLFCCSTGGYYSRWMAMDVYVISDVQSFRDSTTTASPTTVVSDSSDPTSDPSDPASDPTNPTSPQTPGVQGRGGSQRSSTALPSLLLLLFVIVTVVLSH